MRDRRTREPSRTTAIGGHEIGRCLTRIHHDRFSDFATSTDPIIDRRRHQGRLFEASVLARVLATASDVAVIPHDSADEATAKTLAAMRDGASHIVGARLVDDVSDLVGMPDLLLNRGDGYTAIEIKNHRVVGPSGIEAAASHLHALTRHLAEPVWFRSGRGRDLLQATHYWLLLETAGFATAEPSVGVIGNDDPIRCLWVDASRGEPSILEVHDRWVADAHRVLDHGTEHPDVPLVAPWIRTECDTCDWRDVCIAQLTTADDPTLLRGVDATTRDALADQGVFTVTEVADLDPTDPGVLRSDVVFQARARVRGGLLSAGGDGDPMDLPSSRVEVDLDLETHAGSVYLAGLMTTVAGVSTYEAITDWSNTTRGERRLVTELFARLVALGRQDAIVFHWTDYEVRTLATLAERHDVTIEDHVSVEAWFAKHACDLCEWSRQHLASPAGYSLKVVAPLCGFSWRDVDPGGLQSEIWFEDLLAGDATMRQRLLEYNEDDVRAQLAVRSWVRRHDDGSGPGSTIPSVLVWPFGG